MREGAKGGLTGADDVEGAVEVIFGDVGEDGAVLCAHLLVCAEDDDEESAEGWVRRARGGGGGGGTSCMRCRFWRRGTCRRPPR